MKTAHLQIQQLLPLGHYVEEDPVHGPGQRDAPGEEYEEYHEGERRREVYDLRTKIKDQAIIIARSNKISRDPPFRRF